MSTETVELTELEQRILRFESTRWQYAGAKETAILVEFGMSATRFYSTLNALIDTRAAMAFDPLLVKRLQRMRAARQRQRTRLRLGLERE